MGLGFVGMLWANRQYQARGVPWGRPLAALLGIISLCSAISIIIAQLGSGSGQTKAILEREKKFQYVAYKRLGQEVAKRFPRANILLIREKSYPQLNTGSSQTTDMNKLQEDAFREGLAGKARIEAVEQLSSGMDEYMYFDPGPDGKAPTEIDYKKLQEELFTGEKLDKLIEDYPNCNVVVSFLGLPQDMKTMKLWTKKPDERPALVLAQPYIYELKPLIKLKYCPIILYNKPLKGEGILDMEFPDNEEEAFNKRYLLITPENVDQIAKEYPKLFAPDPKKK
ncbi:MAG: hypothetical protein D6820_01295 [Lentisphaerae bacterium]|nr:MAG: hypothetical protein D6820_01295 [Lentisphaerota bacterium]